MATIIANGNASIMSRAMYDTEDGYFEHATQRGVETKRQNIYGPETVWVDGEAYPNATWAKLRIHPVEHPYIKGRWIHPDRVQTAKYYHEKTMNKNINKFGGNNSTSSYSNPATGSLSDTIKTARKLGSNNRDTSYSGANSKTLTPYQVGNILTSNKSKQKASSGTKNALNALSDAANFETSRIRVGADIAGKNYREAHGGKGNAVGETLARARGGIGNSAVGHEYKNIRGGAQAAMEEYDRTHGGKSSKPSEYADEPEGTKLGRAMAGVRGGIGASAVGRAGKAAFKAIVDKFDAFKAGINKYLTGEGAKENRSQLMKDLGEKGGALINQIKGFLGNSDQRGRSLGKLVGTVSGTAAGVASGIASSRIGQAAISAGQKVYGAVRDKVGGALDSIQRFFFQFRKRGTTSSTAHLNTRAASV